MSNRTSFCLPRWCASSGPALLSLLMTLCPAGPLHAGALSALVEVEPNDTPATANPIAGAVRLLGTMAAGDQDAFLWTVSDVDAQSRWTFELEGIPGTLTILEVIRLEYAEDGQGISGREVLFSMGSRDGTRMAVAEDLLFEPGQYLLGLARAGADAQFRPPMPSALFAASAGDGSAAGPETEAGGYRLNIRRGAGFTVTPSPEDPSTREKAVPVVPDYGHLGYAMTADSWFEVVIDEQSQALHLDLHAQVPVGYPVELTLFDADGGVLSRAAPGARGHLRMPELALAPGRYLVHLVATPDTLRMFAVARAGERVDGAEAEPNDDWPRANRVDLASPVAGRFQRTGDTDYFLFPVTEAQADGRLSLQVVANDEQPFTLCLSDHHGQPLQCRSGPGTVQLPGLALEPGDYGASLAYGMEGTGYQLQLRPDGAHAPGIEAEPNDDFTKATSLPRNLRIKGTMHYEDKDFYRLLIDGEPQLWRFQVMGEGVHEVTYHDGAGAAAQSVRASADQRRIILDQLFLLPGVHYLSVTGSGDGEYTLLARALGQPDENAEREPNDDPTRMLPLAIGQSRTGTLPDVSDRDNYRFSLADYDHIRLSIVPPPDGGIRAMVYWDGTPIGESAGEDVGGELVLEGLFPPGDYRLELIATRASDAEYRLGLERRPRFGCPVDCEPNNNPAFAAALPRDGVLVGTLGDWRDDDWYALPIADQHRAIVIESEQPLELALAEHLYDYDRSRLVWDDAARRYTGTIPAGARYHLKISGNGGYALHVQLGASASPPSKHGTAVGLVLRTEHARVAAYQPFGQQIEGLLELANPRPESVTLTLRAASSDARWTAVPEPAELQIGAGATASARLRITVPDDAWAERPVRISVQAISSDGAAAEAWQDIAVDRDAALVNPVRHRTVPEPLRGGLNLAWQALGGRRLPSADGDPGLGHDELFDGMAIREEGLGLPARNEPWPYQSTVELAGQQSVEVVGVALHPAGRGAASDFLRRFELALSENGEDFETVFAGILEPRAAEQYFSLERARTARYARLHFLDDYTGNPGGVRGLGEWKVIARPGVGSADGAGFNLAAPALGGHVVWSRPPISHRWDDEILSADTPLTQVRLRAGDVLEWVVGFHHNRAAKIAAVDWVDPPTGSGHEHIASVDVAFSTDSPLGPWQTVGAIKLAGESHRHRLEFAAPEWARFVRFTTSPATADAFVDAPGELRIIEKPGDEGYRSILGEWGFADHRAGFEEQQPIAPPRPFQLEAHATRARAAALAAGTTVDGRVLLGQHEHWYRLQMPAGHNRLDIRLAGVPTVRAVMELESTDGEPVPYGVLRRRSDEHWLEAFVEAGSEVYLRVSEPPRNVVFAWDTSASVGAYLPVIYTAMASYARGLVPGRDAANLMPFGSPLLLQEWYGEPYLLQTILNEYPRGESSSEAEETLAAAADALAQRAGAKAIVLITDAATGRDSRVWDAFERVRPRVIALGLDSHGAFNRDPPREQDLMQDWARASGGHYAHLRSEGEMEVAFDRAAMLLREPAPYQLTVDTEFREAPGPGKLSVTRRAGVDGGGSGGGDGSGILLILDASGSMLQRMDGKRRIEIAREVLVEAVTKHLRPGTPVALRVFGHREPNACRSDLELPLAPLDPPAATAVIRGVEARNLARTPIADTLALAASDLGTAAGSKTIVLLTDGEETCDGDPEAVIRRLAEQGLEVRLNVIGFALDDTAIEAQFQSWAGLGGGQYFKADDAAGLSGALAQALRVPFVVYDRDGSQVAQGAVGGDAIELPAGSYRVLVRTSPPQTFESVDIQGGGSRLLEVD